MKTIKIKVYADGSIEAEGNGFKGKVCDKAMAFLKGLGNLTFRKNKGEYWQKDVEEVQTH